MKRISILFLCVLLCGCHFKEMGTTSFMQILERFDSIEMPSYTNMQKKYYNYYLPKGVGRRKSTQTSEVFVKNGYPIVMNFDPSMIVMNEHYKTTSPTNEEVKSDTIRGVPYNEEEHKELLTKVTMSEDKKGTGKVSFKGYYKDIKDRVYSYQFILIPDGTQYCLYFQSDIVNICSVIAQVEIESIMHIMMMLAKSIDYHETEVLQNFSMKSINEVQKDNLQSIQSNISSSGSLPELLDPSSNDKPDDIRH